MRSSAGVGITPPKVLGTAKPWSSVMISSTLGASLGGTTRAGHQGVDCSALRSILPPNFCGGGGSWSPGIVVVAPGEPSTPVIWGADAGATPAAVFSGEVPGVCSNEAHPASRTAPKIPANTAIFRRPSFTRNFCATLFIPRSFHEWRKVSPLPLYVRCPVYPLITTAGTDGFDSCPQSRRVPTMPNPLLAPCDKGLLPPMP